MNIEFTIDEAWRIYERIKEDSFYFEKLYAIFPDDRKEMIIQQASGLNPITSKLETAFPKFLEVVAQNELERRAEERMRQEGFR
ncbi:MAG: hypothetical protein FWE21_09065 [Defluviitaleaceae bacterium]|nr:hypothetical protein [Defluviitaleaceae bacterium]